MTQGIDSGESAEVRKAIERLQYTLGIMGDRYRDLRHERRQMRERIDQLEHEREATGVSVSARLEAADRDREQAAELEGRALQAERAQAEMADRLAGFEQAIAERDALIANQAEVIERQQQRLEEERRREEENWSAEERFSADLQQLREDLARATSEAERYKEQIREMEEYQRGQLSRVDESTGELNRQIADMRAIIVDLENERAGLQESQSNLSLRLDEMTRDVMIARNRSVELESEIEMFRTQLQHASTSREEIGGELIRLQTELEEALIRLETRENDFASLNESLRLANAESARTASALQSEISTLHHDLEHAQKANAAMEAERDSARGTVESLLVRLKQLEASDDERLKAQRTRIDELTVDLSEALDMAAKKETEVLLTQTEMERLQRQIAELTERREELTGEVEKLRQSNTNGAAGASSPFNEKERRAIAEQLRDAITLIDKHLGDQ